MSTRSADISDLADELPSGPLPKLVSPAAASSDQWVTTFAMLTLSGVGLDMSAERLGKPKQVLEQLFKTPSFQTLLKSVATETGKDAAVALLKSSAVDNVLTMINLRDRASSEHIRLRAASQLLQWNYFHQKSDDLQKDTSAVHDALRKSGLDVDSSLDRELERIIRSSPVLLANPLLASLIPNSAGGGSSPGASAPVDSAAASVRARDSQKSGGRCGGAPKLHAALLRGLTPVTDSAN